MKKFASLVTGILLIIGTFWFLSSPSADATPKAKISKTMALTTAHRAALGLACSEERLKADMTEKELGLKEDTDYKTKYVSSIVLETTDKKAVVTVTLEDIYSDWRFWSTLKVEKGKTVVLTGQCDNKIMKWDISGTTPKRYLPKLQSS